jgi:hypothetical protein
MVKTLREQINDYIAGKDDTFALEMWLFPYSDLEGCQAYYGGLKYDECVELSRDLQLVPEDHDRCQAKTKSGEQCKRYDGRVRDEIDYVYARRCGRESLCPYHRKIEILSRHCGVSELKNDCPVCNS